MRRTQLCAAVIAAAMAVCALPGAVPVKKKAPAKPAVSTAKTTRPAARTASATRGSKKAAPVSRTTWRNRQMSPAPERYKEIQEALVAKGYLSSEDANGAWNTASTEALKRFQSEQNIESNGKINSLSLIALGLGPKRDNSVMLKTPAAASVQAELPEINR